MKQIVERGKINNPSAPIHDSSLRDRLEMWQFFFKRS